jgi:putative sigma-54 modulation protein
MNLVIVGHQIEVTDAMREFFLKGFESVKKRFPDIATTQVTIAGMKKNGWAQSIVISARVKNRTIVVKQFFSRRFEDFYSSITEAVRLLGLRLSRNKARKHVHSVLSTAS